MEQQLPLFAARLPPSAQQTIWEALTLLEWQIREPEASFTSSSTVRNWLRLHLATLDREAFTVLWLDNQHQLIVHDTPFYGAINTVTERPREVVKSGLKKNAAAAILAHNHLSALAQPSDVDRRITQRLKQGLISACWTIWWTGQ